MVYRAITFSNISLSLILFFTIDSKLKVSFYFRFNFWKLIVMISRDVEKAGRLSVGGWWIEMPSNFLNNPMMDSHLWNFFKKFSKFSNRHLVRFCGIFKKTIIWSIWLTTFNGNPRIIIIKLVLLKIISSNFSIERGQSVMSYQAGWTSTNKHAKQQMILRSFFFF